MTAFERRQTILEILRKQPGTRVHELAEAAGVSDGTIRNDLNALETAGRLIRVHGGAVLKEPTSVRNNSFSTRQMEHAAAKSLIARHAADLVRDGDSILLDASSTVYYFAQAIQGRNRLRVVTNGLDVAQLLAQHASNTVILIGGILNHDGSSVTGLFSERIINELHIQKAFVSCSGFSLERGMTEVHIDEAQLKRKVIESAQELIALIDSSKFGKEDLTPFARVEQISQLITDPDVTTHWAQSIEQAGIALTISTDAA